MSDADIHIRLPSAGGYRARARRLARVVRRAPERLLHPLRHRRTARQVRARDPSSILVICLGNICRSPYAAALLERELGGADIRIGSAGFIGPGRPSPEVALHAAARRGIDLSAHRSRLLTNEHVRDADLIVVMDLAQRRRIEAEFGQRDKVLILGDLDPDAIDTRTIRDPYDQTGSVFDQVYARIDRCVGVLARNLNVGKVRMAS